MTKKIYTDLNATGRTITATTFAGNASTVTNGVYTTDTGSVTNTMLAGSIADTKLSTISTAGKVSNSATTAASSNTASAIVARDSSGNFSAGTITASLSGNASTVTNGVYTTDSGTVTNLMLAGSIANAKLSNSSITINGSAISLGGTVTTPDTNTTYTFAATGTSTASLNLTPSSGSVTSVTIAGSGATTVAQSANAITISSTDTDTNWYPTAFAWTAGTTAGPTGSLTGTGMSAVSYAAIPAAGASASGIVTTGTQTFAGTKTFSSTITADISGNAGTVSNGVYTNTNNVILGTLTVVSPGSGSNGGLVIRASTGASPTNYLQFVNNANSAEWFNLNATGAGTYYNSNGNHLFNSHVYTTASAAYNVYTTSLVADASVISTSRSASSGVNTSLPGYALNTAGYGSFTRDNSIPLYVFRYNASGTVAATQFYYAAGSGTGVASGLINISSGGTPAFAAASDYRAKENIVPVTNALERMKLAKAYTFNKIESVDPTLHSQTGFLAHELHEVHPDAVLGEKDAVDENGDPIYQEVMEARLIPIMAQAMSDLIKKVELLEERIAVLEGKL